MKQEQGPIAEYGPENFAHIAEELASRARKNGMSAESVAAALVAIQSDFEPSEVVIDDDDLTDVFIQALEAGITREQIDQTLG